MSYTVISWYTDDYRALNDRLIGSLEAHGHTQHVEYKVPTLGRWHLNAMLKPSILKRAFRDVQGDLVYIDSDAIVRQRLTLFDNWTGEDLGAHYLRGTELLGGTQYWSFNSRMINLIEAMEALMLDRQVFSQVALRELLPTMPEISVKRLPPEYCYITDTSRFLHPGVDPVVEHFQESRRARQRFSDPQMPTEHIDI